MAGSAAQAGRPSATVMPVPANIKLHIPFPHLSSRSPSSTEVSLFLLCSCRRTRVQELEGQLAVFVTKLLQVILFLNLYASPTLLSLQHDVKISVPPPLATGTKSWKVL